MGGSGLVSTSAAALAVAVTLTATLLTCPYVYLRPLALACASTGEQPHKKLNTLMRRTRECQT